MKKCAKKVLPILLIAALVLAIFSLTACKKEEDLTEKTVTLMITGLAANVTVGEGFDAKTYLEAKDVFVTKEYTLNGAYLVDLLNLAKDDKDINFTYKVNETGFVTEYEVKDKVSSLTVGGTPMFYTSDTKIDNISPGFNVVIKGTQYNTNGEGINTMPLVDGETYIITYQIF